MSGVVGADAPATKLFQSALGLTDTSIVGLGETLSLGDRLPLTSSLVDAADDEGDGQHEGVTPCVLAQVIPLPLIEVYQRQERVSTSNQFFVRVNARTILV